MDADADSDHSAPGKWQEETDSLVFQGCLDEADLVNIYWCLDRLRFRRPVRWLVSGVVTLLAILGVAAIMITANSGQEVHAGVIFFTFANICLFVYINFILSREREWTIRRYYRRDASKYIEGRITLNERYLAGTSKDGSWDIRWKVVGRVVDVPPGLLFLNTAGQTMFWLPERVFDDAMVRQRVLGLCHANGIPVQTRL